MTPSVNGVTGSGSEPIEHLIAAVKAGGAERWAALAALAQSSDPRAYDALTEYAGGADWTVRRGAVEALGQRGDGHRAEALLRVRLRDDSPHVVRAACEAVGSLRLATLRSEVLQHLRAKEAATRSAALRAVEGLWAAEDTVAVLEVYDRDADVDVRRDAAFILRRKAGPEWRAALVTRWRNDVLPRHRVWACELAAASGAAQLRQAVAFLVSDQDGHVRAAAQAVIAAAGAPPPNDR